MTETNRKLGDSAKMLLALDKIIVALNRIGGILDDSDDGVDCEAIRRIAEQCVAEAKEAKSAPPPNWKYKDLHDCLESAQDEYMVMCQNEGKEFTDAGLLIHLFSPKREQAFVDVPKNKDRFETVEEADTAWDEFCVDETGAEEPFLVNPLAQLAWLYTPIGVEFDREKWRNDAFSSQKFKESDERKAAVVASRKGDGK